MNTVIAYVDGSYNDKIKQFSYGIVLLDNLQKTILFEDSHSYNNKDLISMRNVAGEIFGSMAAMQYAADNKYDQIIIYYDYFGIEKWCTREWKANKFGTIQYRNYYDKIKNIINIQFVKIKSHSKNIYNDRADALAKKALGL